MLQDGVFGNILLSVSMFCCQLQYFTSVHMYLKHATAGGQTVSQYYLRSRFCCSYHIPGFALLFLRMYTFFVCFAITIETFFLGQNSISKLTWQHHHTMPLSVYIYKAEYGKGTYTFIICFEASCVWETPSTRRDHAGSTGVNGSRSSSHSQLISLESV